jgi:dTDP-4-dehydrorhamnose reductase
MWFIVGGDSEIGAATCRHLRAKGQAVAASTRRPERIAADRPLLDLSQTLDDWEPPTGTHGACISAAVARLGACQLNPSESEHINVKQTLAIIEHLIARGIYVLFLSTNQVFDGETPYVATNAPTCPVSEYGRQKACAEALLYGHMARGAPIAVLRLAKVVTPGMELIRNWRKALLVAEPIRAFHDMQMAPTPIDIVVETISNLMAESARGIFQLSGPFDISYLQVGLYVAEQVGAKRSLVEPVSARSFGLPLGSTPRHTTLDCEVLRSRYSLAAPDPWAVVDSIMEPDAVVNPSES